ncbi:hypothetical protein J4453_02380, partial [Candidatus Woesearchaeota archaeon]|nr:hypothetical protein [Candidatus Woesearchaeota archaeon]
LLDGQLRYSIAEDFSIGDFISRIIPFAQRDVVDMFMQGVDLDYQTTQESSTKEAMEDYTDFLLSSVKELKNLTNKRKKNLRNNILKSNKKLLNNLRDFLERYRKDRFQDPITRNTSILPKDELANMAESLVNLTSFKRRVSFTKETVGGPIDVAIITKGDGFIWIKRKHYFDPIYNHHYFRKYYHGVIEGGEKNEKE